MKCRVTDYVEEDLDWEAGEYKKAGIDFKAFKLRGADPDALLAEVRDADVLVVDQAKINADVMAGLEHCGLIIRHGDGYDNLDLAAATARGIVCVNKPGFWVEEVANHALLLTLAALARFKKQLAMAASFDRKNNSWNLKRIFPLPRHTSNTIGILGFGKVGRVFAAKTQALGFRVSAHDPLVDPEIIRKAGAAPVGFDELIAEADALSLHVPGLPGTSGLFTGAVFSRMKPTAVLINTSRGAAVNTKDLVSALQEGIIAGAALDVTNPEPLPEGHPLFDMDNVVITPHLAWYSEDALWTMRKSIMQDVLNFRDGRLPASVVNPEVLTQL
ncbi:MAG: C-terminal binding protein [Spirochaetales bacterium]|nr:MAG: C-terminal binding protein [Spirochaetales bacterium]